MLLTVRSVSTRYHHLSSRTVAFILQGILWGILTAFYYALYNRPNFHFAYEWAFVLMEVSYGLILFNSLVYLLIPRWLLRGHYGRAVAGGLGLCVLYRCWGFGAKLLLVRLLPASAVLVQYIQYRYSLAAFQASFTTFAGLINMVCEPLVSAMFPITISFLAYALLVDRRRLVLESTRYSLELSYLKAQLNPQFLFSTLQQLQHFVRSRDPRAGEVILHLADLLRYTLYETNADRVALVDELNFLATYLELARLRYPGAVIDHLVVGESATMQLAPLLLLPFWEQACAVLALAPAGASLTSRVAVEDYGLTATLTCQLLPTAPTLQYRTTPAVTAALRRLQQQYPARHAVQVQETNLTLHLSLRLLL